MSPIGRPSNLLPNLNADLATFLGPWASIVARPSNPEMLAGCRVIGASITFYWGLSGLHLGVLKTVSGFVENHECLRLQ